MYYYFFNILFFAIRHNKIIDLCAPLLSSSMNIAIANIGNCYLAAD